MSASLSFLRFVSRETRNRNEVIIIIIIYYILITLDRLIITGCQKTRQPGRGELYLHEIRRHIDPKSGDLKSHLLRCNI